MKYLFEGWALTLEPTDKVDNRGCAYVHYTLGREDSSIPIFDATDFRGSPMHSADGEDAARSLLGFLTLRPGDTDPGYFSDYTSRQMEFAETHAEYLSLYADEEDPPPFDRIED